MFRRAATTVPLPLAERLRALLSTGPLTRSVATVALGHAGAYAVMLLATPVLTRLYSPAAFGVLSAFTAVLSLLGVSVCLCYETAIPLPKSTRRAKSLFRLAVTVSCGLAAAWGLVAFLAGGLADRWPAVATVADYAPLLALNLAAYGVVQALTFWATRTGGFRQLAGLRITLVLATVATQLLLATLRRTPTGLIAGQALGYVAAATWAMGAMRPVAVAEWFRTSLLSTAQKFARFPKYKVGSETLNIAQTAAPPLAVVGFFGAACAGWFMLAWRVVGAPLTMLVVPIARVYLSRASQIGKRDRPALEAFFRRTLGKALLVAGPVVAGIALVSPTVFPIAFGAEWADAGYYCRSLCPMLLCHLLAISVRSTFDVVGRQDLQLAASALSSLMMLACLASPLAFDIVPGAYIAAISAVGSLGYGATIALCWYAIRQPTPSMGGDR